MKRPFLFQLSDICPPTPSHLITGTTSHSPAHARGGHIIPASVTWFDNSVSNPRFCLHQPQAQVQYLPPRHMQ
ncbi:hypothetical protein E2C01_067032 [Portunus trituberculatus]|uniref:Uncharacterized protein n=1 Tax=Portunus trituberculatus TaxID=210409 RepID=A0A5B7HJS5_PORTR|nr:hypothetical protein [Portunus trituberculatus]